MISDQGVGKYISEYLTTEKRKIHGALCVHVDDINFCGDEKFNRVMAEVIKKFQIKSIDKDQYKYLGGVFTQKMHPTKEGRRIELKMIITNNIGRLDQTSIIL